MVLSARARVACRRPLCHRFSSAVTKGHPRPRTSTSSSSSSSFVQDILMSLWVPWMSAMQPFGQWTMDKARMGLVLHSNSSRWLGTRPGSIKIKVKLIDTGVVPNQQIYSCLSHHSQRMDTQLPLFLVIVNMHAMYMHRCETPQCTPRLSALYPHSGLVLKVNTIQKLLPTYSQRKLTSSYHAPRPRTRRGLTRSTCPLDPLRVDLNCGPLPRPLSRAF